MPVAATTKKQPPRKKKPARRASLSVVRETTNATTRKPSTDVLVEHAQCRSLGHSWTHRGTYNPEEDGQTWQHSFGAHGFVSICDSCTAKRIKWIMHNGSLGQMSYQYPEGYSEKGEDRRSTIDWRRTFIVKMFGDA